MLVFLLKCSVHLEGGFMETRLNEDHSGFPVLLREECAVQRLAVCRYGCVWECFQVMGWAPLEQMGCEEA